jgi:hypothetical protein
MLRASRLGSVAAVARKQALPGAFARAPCACGTCRRGFASLPHMEHFEALDKQLDGLQNIAGVFSGDHAVYHAVAEAQTGTTMHRLREGHSGWTDEYKVPELVALLNQEACRMAWKDISSLNPLGMDSLRPSISATPANMEVPEIMAKLRRDGTVVNEDGSIKVVKVAIDPVWHIPRLAKAVGVTEENLRERLYAWTQNDQIMNPENSVRRLGTQTSAWSAQMTCAAYWGWAGLGLGLG